MTGAKIMVVEDEAITAKDIEARLRRMGYDVPAIAASGPEAIERAATARPDLVLMDIKLQGAMDGVQVAQELQSRFRIPVTYLTAYADDATLARAQLTAPYGYLVKPFDERELRATIQIALYRHRVEQQAEEASRLLDDVNEALLELTPVEERLVRVRFGMVGSEGCEPGQVAKQLQVSRAEVGQLSARALRRLRGMSGLPKSKR
jgi:CheY-like chemotaxis protein